MGLMAHRTIKDNYISVEICNVGLEGDTPALGLGASPPFEDCHLGHSNFCCTAVKNVDLVAVAGGDVPYFGKFPATEEGLVG